jgi:hypothetical protein
LCAAEDYEFNLARRLNRAAKQTVCFEGSEAGECSERAGWVSDGELESWRSNSPMPGEHKDIGVNGKRRALRRLPVSA